MWVQQELPFEESQIKPRQVLYNECCKKLEDEFYAGNKDALGLLFLEIRKQAEMIINAKRSKSGFFINTDDVQNKAEDAATNMIMRYYKTPGFRFKSFAIYTDLMVRQQLWHRRECDKIQQSFAHETVTAMYNAERMRKVKVYVKTKGKHDTQGKNKVQKNKGMARVYRCILKRKPKVCPVRQQGNDSAPQD